MTDLDRIKAIPIEEVLEEAGIEFSPRPSGFKVRLREDDNTPSCHIYPDNNSWFDFGSGKGGSVIDLVMHLYSVNLERALLFLEAFELPEVALVRQEKEILDFTDRIERETEPLKFEDLGAITAKWPGIGPGYTPPVRSAPNSIWIPHYQPDGSCPGVKVRSLSTWDKVSVKGSNFTQGFYWPYEPEEIGACDNIGHLVIVEGESDAWCAASWYGDGDYIVVGLPSGAGCWDKKWLEPFTSLDTVTLWLDDDEPGRKAFARIVADLNPGIGLYDFSVLGRCAEKIAVWRKDHG